MGQKGLDFKHKEVINIKDGRRLRVCSRCVCRFREWHNYIYNCTLIENSYKVRKTIIVYMKLKINWSYINSHKKLTFCIENSIITKVLMGKCR